MSEAIDWRKKYFEMERAHSHAVDKIGELTARVMLRERELAERGSDKSALEQKIAHLRNAYDHASQGLHDCGLENVELKALLAAQQMPNATGKPQAPNSLPNAHA